MSEVPDGLDAELLIPLDRVDHLITELELVCERFLTENLVTAHAVVGALEDLKLQMWSRMEAERRRLSAEEGA